MTNPDGRTRFAVLTIYDFDETVPIAPLTARAIERARVYGPRNEGFLSCRVFEGEDRRSIVVLTEWVSREAFEAFRHGADGQEVVAEVVDFHPKIRFLLPAGTVAHD